MHLFNFWYLLEEGLWRHLFGKTIKERCRYQFACPCRCKSDNEKEFFKVPSLSRVKVSKMLQSCLVTHWMMRKPVTMAILIRVFPKVNATAFYSLQLLLFYLGWTVVAVLLTEVKVTKQLKSIFSLCRNFNKYSSLQFSKHTCGFGDKGLFCYCLIVLWFLKQGVGVIAVEGDMVGSLGIKISIINYANALFHLNDKV